MAAFNFKFALLVAFLVVFIGHGLVSDAKPIERKESEDEKEAPTEVAAASEDSADEDEADDSSTRSKVRKPKKSKAQSAYEKCKRRYKGQKKKIDKNCKREFNLKGAIRPFDSTPGRYLGGGPGAAENFSPDDRSEDEGNYEDYDDGPKDSGKNFAEPSDPADSNESDKHFAEGHLEGLDSDLDHLEKGFSESEGPSKVSHKESSNIKEDQDESTIEQQIIEAEGDQRDDNCDKPGPAGEKGKCAADADAPSVEDATAKPADVNETTATPSADEHDEGEMREINGGCYDHHSSECPNIQDQIMQVAHKGDSAGFHGAGCGCGAPGPSGQAFHCGCDGAGHLATYVSNDTNTPCAPNMKCADVCGNINMGLPHPECQSSIAMDKLKEESTKSYSPSCQLVNVNGNVGLSLPHPCIQLTDDQKNSPQSCATVGATCASCTPPTCGSCTTPTCGSCTTPNLCGLGRDDVSKGNGTVDNSTAATNASGESPAAATASHISKDSDSEAGGEDSSEGAKVIAAGFEHHHDAGEGSKRSTTGKEGKGDETGCHRRDCCCDPHYLYHGNELQIVGTACQGVDCHEGGNLQRVLPHPDEQLNGHHYPGCSNCFDHCGHQHVHNPLPHHLQQEMNCGCDRHHGHRAMLDGYNCHEAHGICEHRPCCCGCHHGHHTRDHGDCDNSCGHHDYDGHCSHHCDSHHCACHHDGEHGHCGCGCGHHGHCCHQDHHGGHGGHGGCCCHHGHHDDCCCHHGHHDDCCCHHGHHGDGCCHLDHHCDHEECGEHPGPHGDPDVCVCHHDYKRVGVPYKSL